MEIFEKLLFAVLFFLVGFLTSYVLSLNSIDVESPLSFYSVKNASPSNFISDKDIEVYSDRVVIKIEGASVSSYESTGSMRPVLDKGSNGIRVKPQKENEISVGDIVSFRKGSFLVVHRVVEKGVDEEGIYFITKGDNNNFSDGKIRFSDIEYKTVALIY